MPKRLGNLIPLIAEPDNLRLAAWKAAKGKKSKPEVLTFFQNLDRNVALLRAELLANRVQVGSYKTFRIYDPKERIICAASFRERVLHHAIMNICHDRFDAFLPFHSYASRKGKGTYAAIGYAALQQKKYAWFAKLDVRQYFASIEHQTLSNQLARLFKDAVLLALFAEIMKKGSEMAGRGLPIGNLTSQYWANHYLGACDHFVLQKVKPAAYCRYMDDMVLWHTDKNVLRHMVTVTENFCFQVLALHLKEPIIQQTKRGLPFLGYTIFPHRIRLNARSKQRFRRNMKSLWAQVESGGISQEVFQRRCLPAIDFTRKADTHAFRQGVLRNLAVANG
jgi:RNA-directed DNA polymerase